MLFPGAQACPIPKEPVLAHKPESPRNFLSYPGLLLRGRCRSGLDFVDLCVSWLGDTLISCSSLWTRLDLANIDKTRTYIEHSQSFPLKLYLGYGDIDDAFPLVSERVHPKTMYGSGHTRNRASEILMTQQGGVVYTSCAFDSIVATSDDQVRERELSYVHIIAASWNRHSAPRQLEI